jgi:DNA-directed RNA polymerase subunit omega
MPFFIPNDEEQGVYRFILAAAKRARQLQSGARPTISTTSRKPTRIAMEEIRLGSIEVEILPDDWVAPEPERLDAIKAAPEGAAKQTTQA